LPLHAGSATLQSLHVVELRGQVLEVMSVPTIIRKVYTLLDWIRTVFIIATLTFIIGLGTLQVILRYFADLGLRPFAWGEEIIRLSSLWVSFLAASLAAREGAHLCVTFLIEKYLSEKKGAIAKKAANIVIVAILCYLLYLGLLRTLDNIPTSLLNLNISVAWFYAAIPVGFFYLLVEYLLVALYGEHPFRKWRRSEIESCSRM